MSRTLTGEEVIFRQRLLKCSGVYGGDIDGDWGPLTDAAEEAFRARSHQIKLELGSSFDDRSEERLVTLLLPAQRLARQSLTKIREAGIDARILSGTRTYTEQDRLFAQIPPVTKARGGQSNHNFGIAWDIGVFEGGRYLDDSPLYDHAANFGKVDGVEWGGDWQSFRDRPHYQLATHLPLAEVRHRFEAGEQFI